MAMVVLAYLFAASAVAAPLPSPRVTCSSIQTPQGTIIIDRIAHVFFDSGSARIDAEGASLLDSYVAHYDAQPHCHVFIAAHADRVGPSSGNLELSRRRAHAVSAYLRRRGLGAPITVEFFGEARPMIETQDGVAEPQNRNAVLFVSEPPAP